MTRRDVAVWFCKVIALSGMINTVFQSASNIGLIPSNIGLIPGVAVLLRAFVFSLPTLGLYFFIFLFAGGIGTELAVEGEHGQQITSNAEMGSLLFRCVGLGIILHSALGSFSTIVQIMTYHFVANMRFSWTSGYITSSAVRLTLQFVLGAFLAFGPRIRAAMQPK